MIQLSTPALLFSATSLILLAYTNRFLTIATLIRNLKNDYLNGKDNTILGQIENLNKRVSLIRWMQLWGVLSLFVSVLSMLLLYFELQWLGDTFFVLSLITLLISLGMSAWEIFVSVRALKMSLEDVETNK
ncbi:hypothetical protein UJ101_00954 [Flavobacteriaceae bacterium UJ101]|nr:hypothetical protein UJ101_00954 [Flavobacteriaceae bacterium UJ101]